jgi:PTH1 family peptidyl-tRNA hydrolase
MQPRLVVLGLGNPGPRYRTTRHNVGFRVVELLAERHGVGFDAAAALSGIARVAETPEAAGLVLVKPRTYMNRAGLAACAVTAHYGVPVSRLVVVYDDADLPLGRLRLRPAGRAGGHRGLGSILSALGTEEIPRVRLGVRGATRPDEDLAAYVLRPFAPEEEPMAREMTAAAAEAVELLAERGLTPAMNRYNGWSAGT